MTCTTFIGATTSSSLRDYCTSLFANGHGIPGIIINDTDRHTHALEGFLHSPWVNTRAAFESALSRWQQEDLSAIAHVLS